MEIIIHGKPNAGSHNLTAGINQEFAEKFVNDFFKQSEKITFGNCLIADAYFWGGKWYFTYTYFVNSNLSGVGQDARNTYFALSIIEQNQYYCLISEVYNKLKGVYNTYITGRYIKNGRYIVQDFSDPVLFTGLVNKIHEPGFWINLQEPVDTKFKPRLAFDFNEQYNVVDCDAKAFVQSLREYGRVVVSETFPSKDERLTGINSVQQKLNTALSNITKKDEQIKQLEAQINNINSEGSKKKDENRKLLKKIDELKFQNENLSSSVSQLNDTIDTYKDKLAKIASISGVIPTLHEDTPKPVRNNSKHRNGWVIVNTILLVVVIILLAFNKSCSNETSQLSEGLSIGESIEDNNTKDSRYTDNYTQRYNTPTVSSSALDGASSSDEVNTTTEDVDCGLKVKANDTYFSQEANFRSGTNIIVTVDKEQTGYSLHTHNLKNGENLKLGEKFELKAIEGDKSVIITYRSDDQKKLNPKNKLKLTVQ